MNKVVYLRKRPTSALTNALLELLNGTLDSTDVYGALACSPVNDGELASRSVPSCSLCFWPGPCQLRSAASQGRFDRDTEGWVPKNRNKLFSCRREERKQVSGHFRLLTYITRVCACQAGRQGGAGELDERGFEAEDRREAEHWLGRRAGGPATTTGSPQC